MNNDYFEYVICHRLGEVGRRMSSGWVGLWRRPRQGCWWIQTHRIRSRAWSCIIKSRRCYNFPMRKKAKYDRKKCSNLILTKVERGGVFLSLPRGFLQAPFFKGWVSKKKNYDGLNVIDTGQGDLLRKHHRESHWGHGCSFEWERRGTQLAYERNAQIKSSPLDRKRWEIILKT